METWTTTLCNSRSMSKNICTFYAEYDQAVKRHQVVYVTPVKAKKKTMYQLVISASGSGH